MNSMVTKRFRVTLAVAVSTLVVSLLAGAQPSLANHGEHMPNPEDLRMTTQQAERLESGSREAGQVAKDARQHLNAAREDGNGKLEAAKLKVCQKSEKNITSRMTRMADRAEAHIAVITKIAERVAAYKADRNLTVANYEALAEAAQVKRGVAEAAVTAMREDSTTFKCDGKNPKEVGQGFVQALHDKNTALKDYKTAVKNLNVAIKTAQGEVPAEPESKPKAERRQQ